jgi:hypothetical protein
VAVSAAVLCLILAMMLMRAVRPKPKPKAPARPEGFVERAIDFIQDKPIIAIAAAVGAGILAIRNPHYFGAAIRAFVDPRNPPKA